MKKNIFNENVFRYEKWFEKNYWAYQSELFAVKAQLPKKGKSVEIGVGSGRFAVPLGIPNGVDPSVKMADRAQKRGVNVLDAQAERLPFNNGSFDFALMVTTICFVDDIDDSFSEVHRILKPDGRFIIGFVDKQSDLGKIYQQNKEKSVFYRHAKFYSTEEVLLYLKKAKFDHFGIKQTIFHKLEDVNCMEPVKNGYGQGSFVVIKAEKRE